MFASDKRVSLYGNNVDVQDVSFSSYLNENTMVVKLTHPSHINSKKKVEDGEIGIFGAEKYFKGAMDDQLSRTPHSIKQTNYPLKDQLEKDEVPKLKTGSATPSVRSEASWNSRSGLLTNGSNKRVNRSRRREKTSTVRSLLTSLGCNCNDTASVKIAEKKVHVNEPPVKPPSKIFVGGFTENKIDTKREDCFAFPVLSTRPIIKSELPKDEEDEISHVKTRKNSLEAFGSPILENGKKSFSLERKLTMLNWDGVTPRSENINMIGENNDAGSDASSDLFEIESFSTNGNNAFLARQVSNGRPSNATLANGYAPSEASVAWSVVTASVTGFSIISDYDDTRTSKTLNPNSSWNHIKGNGILSGCNSHKSVRVAGEHVLVSSCEKGPIMTKFPSDTKTTSSSSLPRGHSQHLHIQQQ